MEFKKLNSFQKLVLKYTDKVGYKVYKLKRANFEFTQKILHQKHTSVTHAYNAETSFVHSGNSGDIIYALPAVFELSKNGKAHIYLKINQPGVFSNYHPLGNVMLNQKMADMLTPLLEYQPQISSCKVYNNESIDYDLDEFRKYPILLDRGSICRWYFCVYAINYPLHKPWLIAPKDETVKDYIVIARSHRYRSPHIDYSFLQQYKKLLFVGVQEEYDDMKQMIPNIIFKSVNDFLELASIINGCKLFIGNQSFPFSIAEALKVNRLLEVYYDAPNVIVEGDGANDFMYQPQFEVSVKKLYSYIILIHFLIYYYV